MFNISNKKGFQITFDNGWTVSVQFGPGNYCDNYNRGIGGEEEACGKDGSMTAEIAAWDKDDNWHVFDKGGYTDMVDGYVSANDVLKFMNEIAEK